MVTTSADLRLGLLVLHASLVYCRAHVRLSDPWLRVLGLSTSIGRLGPAALDFAVFLRQIAPLVLLACGAYLVFPPHPSYELPSVV